MFSIQTQQFLNLLFVTLLAYFYAHFYLSPTLLLIVVLASISIEHMFIYIKQGKLNYFSFSSLTTVLGVVLMMVATNIWIYLFAITLGLGQKHFVTVSGRHFFNPSNFSLMMAMFFFYNDAHIVLGQLGDNVYLEVGVIILAVIILSRVERLLIPITFTGIYILMQYIFVVTYDPALLFEDIYLRFYSVSFILFVLFMLTDPRTTPIELGHQIIFSLLIASLSVTFDRYYGFRVQHLFMALFIVSPLVPLFELYREKKIDTQDIIKCTLVIFLALGVIIFVEMQPSYYFEMDV